MSTLTHMYLWIRPPPIFLYFHLHASSPKYLSRPLELKYQPDFPMQKAHRRMHFLSVKINHFRVGRSFSSPPSSSFVIYEMYRITILGQPILVTKFVTLLQTRKESFFHKISLDNIPVTISMNTRFSYIQNYRNTDVSKISELKMTIILNHVK